MAKTKIRIGLEKYVPQHQREFEIPLPENDPGLHRAIIDYSRKHFPGNTIMGYVFLKPSPGPWRIDGSRIIASDESSVIDCTGAMGGSGESLLDKMLIAAAPDGLKAAELAYLHILRTPHDRLRIEGQNTLCAIRDFIASATGRTREDVQNEFEEKAIEENHKALEKQSKG